MMEKVKATMSVISATQLRARSLSIKPLSWCLYMRLLHCWQSAFVPLWSFIFLWSVWHFFAYY